MGHEAFAPKIPRCGWCQQALLTRLACRHHAVNTQKRCEQEWQRSSEAVPGKSCKDEGTHPREAQPPRQATKVPLATDVGPGAKQDIQPQISRHLQKASEVRVSFPVVFPQGRLVQVPGHICLHQFRCCQRSALEDLLLGIVMSIMWECNVAHVLL